MASKFTITAELNLQTKNLSQVVNNLKQQFQGADLNIKIKDLAKAEASLRNISTGAKDASASMGMLGGSINQAFRRFTVVTLATGTIVGFTRALKNAVGDAIEFERELVKIAQATGQSVAQLRGLATEVGNVSSSFGVSSKELILAARSLTQAGFAADKVTGSLKILAQTELAATFDSISNTTEGAIALLNQFGKQAQKTGSEVAFLEKSFSAINQVSKEFAVESSDLVTAVRTTGAAFEAAGGNLNELLALFTSVRSTTRESAESISTGFRTIFTRIQRVDTINNLKALGIQLQDVEGKFVGPMEATKRLSMALSTIDPRDFRFNLIVEELGGFRQVSKVIPLIQQFATTQKALNVAQGSSGSLAKDAQTAQLSLAVQISKTREEFLRFIRDLTETESFQGTVRTLLNMANAFIKVADTIKPLIPLLGAFAALRIGQSIIPAIASVAGARGNKKAEGGVIHKFARGGLVPGEGNSDTVPAMLTPGEFVIRKSSVKKLGVDNLAKANKYAGGGKIIGNLGGVASNTSIFKDNKDIGLQQDKMQVSVRRIKIPINESIYNKLEKGGRGWEDYLAQKYGYKQYPSATGEKNTESDFRYPIDMESASSYIDAKDFKSTSSVPIVEGYKKSLSHLLYQKYKSQYKFQGASKNIINSDDDNFYGTKLTEASDSIISPKNMLLLFPDVKKGLALGGLIQKLALGGPAGKSRAARAITIPRIDSYTFDKPAGADLDSVNSKKQQYKLNAEDRLDYDVNNVNVDVSKLKVSQGLLEQYNTADDQKRGYRFEDILKETGMAKSLSQVSNARLDGITAAGDPFEAKSRKSAIGIGELEDKLYGAISDNISDPEQLARARFNANDLTKDEDHIKIGKVTVFEDVTKGLGAAVKSKARMGYAEEEAAKQAKEQSKMTAVNAQERLKDLVDKNFSSGYKIFGTQYNPIKAGTLHPDVASLLNKKLGGSYKDKFAQMSDEQVIDALNGVIVRRAMGGGNLGTDTVPAMLTPGEYVINKKSAQAIGYGALNRMNKVGKFANGGPVQFLNPGGGVKGAFGNTTNVTAQPFANFTATTANPYPKAPPSSQKIDVLSSALEQSAKTIGQGADKVTNKFGDVSDQLLLFGPAITGFISQMGMFDKATADMVSATTFTFSTIKGVGGNLTQQAGKLFGLKENSKLFTGLNAGVTGFAAAQAIAAGKAQYFGQTVEEQGKKFNSFVESLSKNDAVSADEMTNVLAQKFNAANKQQASNSGQRKLISGGASLAAGGIATAMTGNPLIGQAAATAAGILTETFYALKDDLQEPSKEIKAQAEALAVAMRSAVTSNRNFQQFMQNIDKQNPTAIIQQANALSEAYKIQTARLAQIKSQDLANASEAVKNDFNAVSEAVKQTTANFQALIGVLVQQSSKQAANLVRQGFMPDSNQLIQPALKAIEDKVNAEYQTRITEAQAKEKAGKAPIGTTALIGKQRDAQIASEQALAKKTLLESIQQNLEMAKSLAIENDLRRQLIGTMQKELGINAAIEQTAYNLNQVAKTVSNIDAVFSGSLTGLKSSYDTETLKMKNPNQENLEKALKPVRAVGPIGEELSNNILDINKVMPILEAKLLQFSNATDTASGGLLDVSKFVKTAFNIDPNGIVGKTLVNIIETTTRGTGGGTNSVTASSTSLREPEVRKKIAETFQKFGDGFKTQAGSILDLMNQTEQEGRVIAEKINESRQRQLELAIQGIDTFSQYIDAVSKARGRDMTLMEKNTIRNMRQYALAGSMGNNSAALGQRLNKIYADLNKGGLSTEQSANLALEAKQLTKALEGLANQSDKTADILQEIDKVKKNRENLRELGREFGTGTAEDKNRMQQDMAAAMTVAQTGTYDSIPEEMRKGADAMLERFKDIPAFKQAQNRAIADTFMKAGNPLAAQMVLQETSTPEEMLIHQLDILFTQQIVAQKTLSLIEAQRQEFLKKAQEDNTTAMAELSSSITALVKHYQDEAAAKAILRTDESITTLPPASATSAEAMGVVNPTGFKPLFPTFFNNNRPKPPVPGVFDATGTTGQLDINSVEGLNIALVAVNKELDTENKNLLKANENIAYFTGLLESSAFVIDGWTGALVNFFSAQPAEIRGGEAGAVMNQAGMGVQRASGGLIYRADGGSIFQPKGTDTVPAMLTPGEFVIKKSSVDKIGADTLSKINAGAYATGGLVSYLAEGGESIANGGAKVNNITLKRVYDQLQAIDKRVAFLEQEYKALSVLIYSGALGGGQQMAQQGGGQQMAQQGGGQQQMANQPQGNGLRSVPPQPGGLRSVPPAREPIKLDDKGNPSPDGKRVLKPIPPEPNNNFRNDLYKDSDGKVVNQNGMPVADWEVKGWRLQANAQQQDDYKTLSKPMTSAGRRSAKKNMRERDLQHENDIVQAVHNGNATAEQKLEYDERYKNKLNADRKKYGEKDADSIDHPHDGRKSYIERRTEAEQISANRRAEEKADPARFKRPSATATWDPVKRIWNDSVAQAEKATMDDPNALESRLLGLTGHKPIKPEDRPAAEARLKALQDQKEAARVAKLNNEQIAREANAELDLAIKKKAPIAQLLPLYDKAEKADAAVRAEREAQSKADAEKRKTAEEESKAKEEKKEPFGTYEDPQTGKRVRDVEFDPILAGTGPQLPFEVEKARRAAAIEEKNKKDVQDGGRRAFNTLLTGSSVQPSNEDIANKVKTSLKGFQEKNIATTTKRKTEEAAAAEKASAEIGPKIPIEIKQQRDVIEENRRKQAELLNYKPKSKTDALPMKSNKPPQFLRDAKGNQNAAEARDLAAMRGDLSGTPGKILGGPGAGILQGLAGIGGLPPLLADTVAGTDLTPKYQNFVEKNVPNQTGTVGEVAKFAGTALAATVTSGASALGSAPTFAKAIPPLIKGAASTGVGELTGRTLDALGVNPLAQAGLGLLTSVGTNRIMGARGKVADSTPDSTPLVAPPVAPVWLDELYDEMFGQAKRPPAKRPPVSKADDAYNATMPKGTTRDEVLRDFRAGDVESPTTPLNTADDILKVVRSPDTVPMSDHNALVNARNQQMAKAPQLQNLGESSKSTSSNPVTPQPYQVDTTQVNTSQADAQTKAAVQSVTAPATSTAPVTETYVNPTAVTSKVEMPPSKPRGVLGRLSNIFNLDNSEIPNKSTFRAGQPIDTAKATTIPTTSPADDILKSVSPYKAGEKSTVQEEYSYKPTAGDPSLSYKNSPTPITDAAMKNADESQPYGTGQDSLDELKKKVQKKASGGLITYLANGGPFYGMPRSGGAFNNFGNAMAGSLNDTSNWMTKSYNDYAHAPSQAFNDTGNWMTGSFNDAASGMTGSFNDAASGMTNSFNNMANFMSGSFQGAGNWMTGSFNDAASGMTNSFNNFAASFEKGGLISYLARGGSPKGTDTVPAMLTPGEFVMKKAAVDKHGTDFMEQLNNGGEVPGFATGGLVDYFGRGGRARARRARARSRQQRGGGLMSVPPSPTGMATPPAVAAPIPPQQEAATTATAATATTPPPETAPTPPAVAAPVPPQQAAATAATAAAATATPPPEIAATSPAVPPQQAAAVATTTPTGLLQRAKDGLWNVGVSASENDVLGPIGRAASGLGTGIGKAILNSVGIEQPELGPTEEIYTKEYGRVLARKYLSGPKSEAELYQIQETVPPQQEAATTATAATATTPPPETAPTPPAVAAPVPPQQEAATTATAATATTPPVKKFNVLTPPPIPPQQEAATTATAATATTPPPETAPTPPAVAAPVPPQQEAATTATAAAATATPPPETAATPPAPLQPRSIPAEYAYGDSRDEKLANLEAKHDADLNTAIKNNESMEFIAQLESKFREEKFAIQREGSGGLKKTKGTGIDIDAEGNELPFGTLANQEIMARITPERHAQFAAETAAKHKKWTDERTVKENERKARELLSDAEFDKKQAAEDAKNYYPNMRQAALDTLKIAGTVGTVATLGTLALGVGGVGMGSAGIAALGGSAYGAGTVVAGAGLVGVAGGLAHQQKRQNEEEADRKSKGYATGGLISYLANGGSPKGSDTVPAMLTPGEFVMKKEAVDKHGTDFMEKLNKGGEVPGFATGGLVNYFRNGGRSGSIAEARARQFNDPRNAGRLEHVARMQTAATGSSYIAQAGAAFAPQRYGNMGGGGGQMEMQQGGGEMQVQQGGQQANGGGLRSVAPSPTGGDSGSTGGGTGAPNMSEVTTALNNMSTAFTGFTDKLNALATAFSGLTITHNIVFGGQINVGGVDGPTIVKALQGYVNTQVTNAIAGLRGENGQAPSKISPVAKQPGQ